MASDKWVAHCLPALAGLSRAGFGRLAEIFLLSNCRASRASTQTPYIACRGRGAASVRASRIPAEIKYDDSKRIDKPVRQNAGPEISAREQKRRAKDQPGNS